MPHVALESEMDKWQPIETAPRTDLLNMVAIPILAFCPNEYHSETSDDRIRIVWWEPELKCWNDDRDLEDQRPVPTHWMPLPAVPEGQ